jgi:hypothetical protein
MLERQYYFDANALFKYYQDENGERIQTSEVLKTSE